MHSLPIQFSSILSANVAARLPQVEPLILFELQHSKSSEGHWSVITYKMRISSPECAAAGRRPTICQVLPHRCSPASGHRSATHEIYQAHHLLPLSNCQEGTEQEQVMRKVIKLN